MDNLTQNLPQIISAAAGSYLGILALLSIVLSVLAYFFFSNASETVRVGIFTLLFAGVASFGAAMFMAPERKSTDQEFPPGSGAEDHANTGGAQRLPDADGDSMGSSETLAKLNSVGIDFSVSEADLKEWLAAEGNSYAPISAALLELLSGNRLVKPVYLDMIVYHYEQAAGSSPTDGADAIDVARLKAAVIKSYNTRYSKDVTDFDALVQSQ